MNLPLVFDIALGLVFIYLTLSLLASEIQELITTLLQWRAEHLKKSIEILVNGDNDDAKESLGITFANQLYQHPVIRSLNQEAKGPLAEFFRRISHLFAAGYRRITGGRNVFGDLRSGPSYIPAASFAAALLEELNLDQLTHEQSCKLLGQAIDERLQRLRSLLASLSDSPQHGLLMEELEALEQRLQTIRWDCTSRRIQFAAAIDAVISQCLSFLVGVELVLEADTDEVRTILRQQLPHLRQAIALKEQAPTIVESIQLVLDQNDALPPHLKRTLVTLAREVDTVTDAVLERVEAFENQVSTWFSRSMERASGVYKRNARGVAILIGCLIAVSTNTDTFYIVNRLSRDAVLRESITQAANQLALQSTESTQLETEGTSPAALQEVKDRVEATLEELPLPIGWNPVITAAQTAQANQWRVPILRRIIGWLVTGIAISMGASFWYSLLGKVMRVRNTGEAPPESRSSE